MKTAKDLAKFAFCFFVLGLLWWRVYELYPGHAAAAASPPAARRECQCCEMFKKLEECRQQLHCRKQILRILAEEKSERGEYVNPELYEEPTP